MNPGASPSGLKWAELIEAADDDTARRHHQPDPYKGTAQFQEWSKARLAFLRERAKAIIEA